MNKVFKILFQVYFGLVLFSWLLVMWTLVHIVFWASGDKNPKQREKNCIRVANTCFRMMFIFTPWVSVNGLQSHQPAWDHMRADIKKGKSVFVMLNHASFLDALLFSAYCPQDIIIHLRTLLKASLCKIPLFGTIVEKCGHFPVHFKSEIIGNFSTDKHVMTAVMTKVHEHVNEHNGSIVFFPEGQIGNDPTTIQSLRRGSFQMAIDNNMSVYSMIMVGNEKSWPKRAQMGGLPAKIQCGIKHIPGIETEENNTEMSERCREEMQRMYDSLSGQPSKVGVESKSKKAK